MDQSMRIVQTQPVYDCCGWQQDGSGPSSDKGRREGLCEKAGIRVLRGLGQDRGEHHQYVQFTDQDLE